MVVARKADDGPFESSQPRADINPLSDHDRTIAFLSRRERAVGGLLLLFKSLFYTTPRFRRRQHEEIRAQFSL
jgi:hypothetical protein